MRRIVFLGAIALAVASCVPVSQNPLADLVKAKPDPRLEGVFEYRDESGDGGFVHFVGRQDGLTDVVLVEHEKSGADVSVFEMVPARLGEHDYMSLREKKKAGGDWMIARYEVDASELRVGLLIPKPVAEAIEAKELAGDAGHEGSPRITASAAELGAFFARPEATRLFQPLKTMKRVASGAK